MGYVMFILVVAGLGAWLYRPEAWSERARAVKRIAAPLLVVAALALAVLFGNIEGVTWGRPEVTEVKDDFVMQGNLKWFRKWELALEEADRTGKPVFVDFYAKWCINCGVFIKNAVGDPELNAVLKEAVLLKIDFDRDPVVAELTPQFAELQQGALPFFVILTPQGDTHWKGSDYKAVDTFRRELRAAKAAPASSAGNSSQ